MKKLSKVTLKLNTALLTVLDELKHQLLTELNGFVRLNHEVKFDNFPASILVYGYFDNEQNLTAAKDLEKTYQKQLKALLLKKGILLKTAKPLQFVVISDEEQ